MLNIFYRLAEKVKKDWIMLWEERERGNLVGGPKKSQKKKEGGGGKANSGVERGKSIDRPRSRGGALSVALYYYYFPLSRSNPTFIHSLGPLSPNDGNNCTFPLPNISFYAFPFLPLPKIGPFFRLSVLPFPRKQLINN